MRLDAAIPRGPSLVIVLEGGLFEHLVEEERAGPSLGVSSGEHD